MRRKKHDTEVIMGVGDIVHVHKDCPQSIDAKIRVGESILYEVEVDDNTHCDRVLLLVYRKKRGQPAELYKELHIPKNERVVFCRESPYKSIEFYGKDPEK